MPDPKLLCTFYDKTQFWADKQYIFSGVFGWWNLMKCLSPNALISLILPHYELFIEFESHSVNTGQQSERRSTMKTTSPHSALLRKLGNLFSIVKSGTFSLKMRKSNSSEKKKMKRPMFCPSLSRKSEGRKNLTSLPWSESIASWATLISGKCARQVRSRKHL